MSITMIFVRLFAWLAVSFVAGIAAVALAIYLYLSPSLPDTSELKDMELQTPLRIFTQDGLLISEFGEKKRKPIDYEQIPPRFIQALLASEDDDFFQHGGIDIKGLIRASIQLITTGKKRSGGSTITMQVAKNYYLSSEKTFARKFTEILLALKIEQNLTKEEILELYINKIYLGKSAYGFEAAAHIYYGRSLSELTLAETAMLAGLPQAPSAANPINNASRATERRNYVLDRMLRLGMIQPDAHQKSSEAPVTASYHGPTSEVTAPYIAEMARRHALETYGKRVYTDGFRVFTTISSLKQTAANESLQRGLLKYDRDHGYRQTPEFSQIHYMDDSSTQTLTNTEAPAWLTANTDETTPIDWDKTIETWSAQLTKQENKDITYAAIVSRVVEEGAWCYSSRGFQFLPFEGIEWAAPYLSVNAIGKKPKQASDVLAVGQNIWLEQHPDGLMLAQIPEVEGGLISLDPNSGAVQALVGGYSQSDNQFNRVTQAKRQPGSAFKPFIYSAALANGFTPASIINDAPVVFEDASLENTWRPENYSGKFYGPTRLRQALYKSQNLVSIRILKQMNPRTAVRFIAPLGIPKEQLNADLSLALGASAVTPMQLATGYASIANGGYAIEPYYIERVELDNGELLFKANPKIVPPSAEPAETEFNTALEHQSFYSDGASGTDQSNHATTEHSNSLNEQQPVTSTEFVQATEEEPLNLAERVMPADVNFLINSMLKDVIQRGTGTRAKALGRTDLAGKTGTTNDQIDAWFSGFNRNLVTTVWVGFDQPKTMGRWAFGGSTALPIWVDYMRAALEDMPEEFVDQPNNIISVRIDPKTGLLAYPGQTDAIFEYFREDKIPTEMAMSESLSEENGSGLNATPELLF
jgi:penicillin-binding protein 1A